MSAYYTFVDLMCVCVTVCVCVIVSISAGLDVDRVCRELDIQALQQNISNVTFCNIESEASQ